MSYVSNFGKVVSKAASEVVLGVFNVAGFLARREVILDGRKVCVTDKSARFLPQIHELIYIDAILVCTSDGALR